MPSKGKMSGSGAKVICLVFFCVCVFSVNISQVKSIGQAAEDKKDEKGAKGFLHYMSRKGFMDVEFLQSLGKQLHGWIKVDPIDFARDDVFFNNPEDADADNADADDGEIPTLLKGTGNLGATPISPDCMFDYNLTMDAMNSSELWALASKYYACFS